MLVELRKKERVEREGEGRGTFDRVSGSTSHIALLAILPYSQSVRTVSHVVALSVFSIASISPNLLARKV